MEIIIDASALIAVIANESERDILIHLTRGAILIAPRSIHWEIGNAFSAMLKRKRITLDQALEAIRIYRTVPIKFVDADLEGSLEVADQLGIYAYDAYLIHCALKYRAPLISLDKNLLAHAEQIGAGIIKVSE